VIRAFLGVAAALVLGAAVLVPRGHADEPANCGLPPSGPLWVDYAGHDAPIMPKPGLVLAVSSGMAVPAAMRAAGPIKHWQGDLRKCLAQARNA